MEPRAHHVTHLRVTCSSSPSFVFCEVRLRMPSSRRPRRVTEETCPSTRHVVGLQGPFSIGTQQQGLAGPRRQGWHREKSFLIGSTSENVGIFGRKQISLGYAFGSKFSIHTKQTSKH